MLRLAGFLPSCTPPRSSTTIATAQLSLTCRVRVRLNSAFHILPSVSRARTSSTRLFCSENRTDNVCACHRNIGAQVRAVVRSTGYIPRKGHLLAQTLVVRTAQTARWGCPLAHCSSARVVSAASVVLAPSAIPVSLASTKPTTSPAGVKYVGSPQGAGALVNAAAARTVRGPCDRGGKGKRPCII